MNALAKAVNYAGIKKLAEDAVKDGFEPMTSEDFGDIVVKFGEYEFQGNKYELTWIPVYVSNSEDEQGNKSAILTLWLATVGTNEVESYQEATTWSSGRYSSRTGQEYNGNTVYCNTYDGSYIRHYILNGSTDYTTGWSEGTQMNKTIPAAEDMTKFSLFVGEGELADFIVEPKYVNWQASANKTKNDSKWNPETNPYGKGENYPSDWLNDKVWLPSVYETYDSTIIENYTKTALTKNGGLWHTSTDERVHSLTTWLRSGDPSNYNYSYRLLATDEPKRSYVNGIYAVRPAIHLNISIDFCKHSLVNHPAVSYCSEEGHEEYWQCSKCSSMFSDKDALNMIDEPVAVNPTGHDYSEEWSSNSTTHWLVCSNGCGTKNSEEEHTWDSGTVTEQPSCTKTGTKLLTCTTCGKTKTEDLPKSEHTYSTEWKYDSNSHWHECTVCKAVQPNSSVAHSGGTADCQNKAKCSICSQGYGSYGAHNETDDAAVAATCTEKGKTAGKHCILCNTVTQAQTDTDALGHDFSVTVSGTQPTCQQGGTATMKCSRCEETQVQDSADPVDHKFTNYISDGNATCTEDGTKTAECDFGCGTKDTVANEGSALGHDFADYISNGDATCTEDGTKTAHCSRGCGTKDTLSDEGSALGHEYAWVITKMPTEDEEGLKENLCVRGCGAKDGEEIIAKLVVDDNGGVADLPTGNDYDLEIAVKESDVAYNIAGVSKGYKVELFVVDGEGRKPYDDQKTVTLMLVIPEGMEEQFKLYRRYGDILEPVSEESYTVDGRTLTIRTTLSAEFVFNSPAPEQPGTALPWWVWLIVAIMAVVLIILIIVIVLAVRKKRSGSVSVTADNGEVLGRLDKQDEKIDKLIEITDGGFTDPVDDE
ncbi:MAG: hypothetical protein K2J54_04265 [Clostridia bacterium]|nr:hypothetical protein [Clostridia bacterium]